MGVAVSARVDTKGFRDMLRGLPPNIRKEVRKTLRRTLKPRLLRKVRARTRVDTGRLRRSAYAKLRPGMELELGYHAPYARFVERRPIGDDVLGRVAEEQAGAVESDLQAAVDRASAKASRRR